MVHVDVSLIVDSGAVDGGEPSTIIDATGAEPRLLRLGALSVEKLNAVLAPHGVSVQEP